MSRKRILTNQGSADEPAVRESFQILRAKLKREYCELDHQILAIASAAPQQGKSFVSANLAALFESDRKDRTLIIDCDLRRPTVHKYFGLPRRSGLSEVLSGLMPLPDAIYQIDEGLHVITAGRAVDDPTMMFSLPRFERFLKLLRKYYRFIILDCPPVLFCSETPMISQRADRTVLVVRAWDSDKELVRDAVSCVGRENVLGVVLNDAPRRRSLKKYNYYYESTERSEREAA